MPTIGVFYYNSGVEVNDPYDNAIRTSLFNVDGTVQLKPQ